MSGGCIQTPVHKYDCWNHGNGACVEKGEDICSGCLSIARRNGQIREREAMAHEQRLVDKLNATSANYARLLAAAKAVLGDAEQIGSPAVDDLSRLVAELEGEKHG